MSMHMLAYTLATGGAVTDADMTAATDSEFSQRNNHYIFTEDYNLLAVYAGGANISRANIQIPTYNAITRFNVWPVVKSANIPANPQLDWWMNYPPPIPKNEEFTVKVSDSANEQATVFLWVGTTDWNQNLPRGMPPLPIFECRVTVAPTITANVWSTLAAITFEQSLRGGVYAVVGCQFAAATLMAVRLVFPRMRMYNNRKLRPGVLAQNAIGDVPLMSPPEGPMVWGEYGRFSTFEPFQAECWGNTGGALSVEGRLWLVRVSEDMDVRY